MSILDSLRAELGDAVTTDAADLDASRADRSGFVGPEPPLAVVRAASVGEVQALMRFATAHRIPVVPRGSGTGLAGGAIASAGAIVLDMSSMNRILEIRPGDELAVVEPGLINDHLNAAAREFGLWFAPDPASKAISSIGGNIATGAGGLLCAKYGVTREAVLGLAVVLADGRLIRTGHRTMKGVTGYDLTALMTGSEGTLGVIVEATVRLRPIPPGEPVTIGASFPDVASAAAAAAAVTAARIRPAVMELMDGPSTAALVAHLGPDALARTPLARLAATATAGTAFLLVQCDDRSAEVDARAALDVIAAAGGTAELAADAAAGDRLLAIRREFHPAIAALGEVLIEDISIPRSRMAEMFAAIDEVSRRLRPGDTDGCACGRRQPAPQFRLRRWRGARERLGCGRRAVPDGSGSRWYAHGRARRRPAQAALARRRTRRRRLRPAARDQARIRSARHSQPRKDVRGVRRVLPVR